MDDQNRDQGATGSEPETQPFDNLKEYGTGQQGGSGSSGGPDWRGSQHGTVAPDEPTGAQEVDTGEEKVGE